jgi:hypothetical protein
VASVIWGTISILLAWVMLDKKGNSNTKERVELIEQILKINAGVKYRNDSG